MDRIEAMRVLVAAVDEGSLAGAGRLIGRSPAAATRAIALLESHVGARLLERSTRSLRFTEVGERYASACRRILADLDDAEHAASNACREMRGLLSITAPLLMGTRILRPIIGEFQSANPAVEIRLLLLDRIVNLIEENVDVALRIAHLPDSNLVAQRMGQVRRMLCASEAYLSRKPPLMAPSDLADHDCIVVAELSPNDTWNFAAAAGKSQPRVVRLRPKLSVNSIEAAVQAALNGEGIARLLSYQIDREVRDGRLEILLPKAEPSPLPVHLVTTSDKSSVVRVRAFLDFAKARLKARFAIENWAS